VICIKPAGLGVDHGGDQRGVQVLVRRLLANDVVVAQRKGDLPEGPLEVDPADADGDPDPEQGRGADPQPPAPP
jgi:hypothetical protein